MLAWILQALAGRLIRLFRAYMARRTSSGDEVARMETLARVFRNTAGAVIFIIAGTLILNELGISVAPILATAGVAGVAIGFGAQSLIKDYLAGYFLLLDDQVRQGDVVELAGKGGLVEEVTLRYVRLRDMDG
ncbi:MAG: mechanosensitive ion channel family protein, partial [Burkholderiales bacterium]